MKTLTCLALDEIWGPLGGPSCNVSQKSSHFISWNTTFQTSQGSAATVYRWGGQIYKWCINFMRISSNKNHKMWMVFGAVTQKQNADVFKKRCRYNLDIHYAPDTSKNYHSLHVPSLTPTPSFYCTKSNSIYITKYTIFVIIYINKGLKWVSITEKTSL